MELRHLRYFLAVAEALNFTKAAARLRVAQPALSRRVRDLEEEIGVGPILAATQARFRRPLTYPDAIAIGARLADLAADRFFLEHRIVSREQRQIVTEGQGTVVTYHYVRREKVPVPEELLRRIATLLSVALVVVGCSVLHPKPPSGTTT